MQRTQSITDGRDWESLFRQHESKAGLVKYVARKARVIEHMHEDLIQDFYMELGVKTDKITQAETNEDALVKTIAVNVVRNHAARDKVRVHVAIDEDVDAGRFLEGLRLHKVFVLLTRSNSPQGFPIYSGKIWQSRVKDLGVWPVVYLKVGGLVLLTRVDANTIADPSEVVCKIEMDSRFAPLHEAVAHLASEYPVHTKILDLHANCEMTEKQMAASVGLSVTDYRQHFKEAKALVRSRYPHLRSLMNEA